MTKKQTSEQEYDVSDLVWDAYKIMYKSNYEEGKSLYQFFDISNPDETGRRKALITDEGIKVINTNNAFSENEKISVSGDVIFNFSKKGARGQSHYDIYKKYIEELKDEQEKNEYLNKLTICNKMHHSIENCSLMIQQGNLQRAKQGIGNDRGDTFIWGLDAYYKGICELTLNHATQENCSVLKELLNKFFIKELPSDRIYLYCKAFYNIDDKELIDALIRSGSKAIDSAKRVQEYIELAFAFWGSRSKFFHLRKLEKKMSENNLTENEI